MRRRLSLTAALVLLLSLLCACAAQHVQEMDENGYELYFLSDPNSAGGGDAIRTQEKRLTLDGAMETEDCVRALMEALLAGPDEPSLSSPIPEGTALKSLKVSGRRAQIDLSAQYARLTGIDLSLADYCITLTLTQLPNVNAVSITADGRELPYRETQVLLSADTLLSSRESGLRPITVSLYFLDSKTGELRAEQQTLALYEGQTRVNALLEALAQGPEDDSLVSLLPEDFAVISSRIENGVCYLNLPASGSLPENEAERDLMLSALEQSILSLGGVDEVQFLIEGSAEPTATGKKGPPQKCGGPYHILRYFTLTRARASPRRSRPRGSRACRARCACARRHSASRTNARAPFRAAAGAARRLICYAARESQHFGEENVDKICEPAGQMLDVVLHDLRARLVAALLGEKRCAAVDTALLRGNRVQQALGVRGHGALRVADQRRGGGVGLEASAAAAGALFAVFRDDHVADLARRARVACQELAAEHHAAADARAERDDDGALRAAAAAEQRLAQRRGRLRRCRGGWEAQYARAARFAGRSSQNSGSPQSARCRSRRPPCRGSRRPRRRRCPRR